VSHQTFFTSRPISVAYIIPKNRYLVSSERFHNTIALLAVRGCYPLAHTTNLETNTAHQPVSARSKYAQKPFTLRNLICAPVTIKLRNPATDEIMLIMLSIAKLTG